MTYNFDPDRWFDNQQARLEQERKEGRITPEEYEDRLGQLTEEYEEMLRRLDIRHDY